MSGVRGSCQSVIPGKYPYRLSAIKVSAYPRTCSSSGPTLAMVQSRPPLAALDRPRQQELWRSLKNANECARAFQIVLRAARSSLATSARIPVVALLRPVTSLDTTTTGQAGQFWNAGFSPQGSGKHEAAKRRPLRDRTRSLDLDGECSLDPLEAVGSGRPIRPPLSAWTTQSYLAPGGSVL